MNKLGVEPTICAMSHSVDRTILAGKSIVLFRAAIKSPRTLDPYERRLCNFLVYAKMSCDQFVALAKKNPARAESILIEYSIKDKDRLFEKDQQRKLAACTIVNRLKPVKLLLDINDVDKIKWKKIKRFLPTPRRFAMDRAPTIDEIRKIYSVCDIRGRAMFLLMLSSGVREGAVEGLLVRHLSPLERNGSVVAARLVAYQGEPEEYMTFLTPEAYHAIQEYLSYRRIAGETVGPDSPIIRDKFEPETRRSRIAKTVDINRPQPCSPQAVRHYFNRLFLDYGFRKEKRKRHEFSIHGFRKWFKTMSEQAMKPKVDEEIKNITDLKLVTVCKRCELENPRDSLYCNRCAFPLAEVEQVLEKKIKLEQMLHSLISDPQELENLRSYLAERRHEKSV